MRPQETRRYEDEAFYFDNGELVVDPSILPEHYPEVHHMQGKEVMATFVREESVEPLVNFLQHDWYYKFQPGDTILNIETSNSMPKHARTEQGQSTFELDAEVEETYQVEAGDLLI